MSNATTTLSTLPRPLALVFSGGASLGAIQVGQVKAIVEAGVQPDFVVGTSVGAINAAYMAREFSADQVERLEAIWLELRQSDVFGNLGLGMAMRLLRGGRTLTSNAGLETLINRELSPDLGSLAIPAHVVAMNYLTGRVAVLSDGDLRRNVLASSAIPNVFDPVTIDGQLLVDGGVSANVPILQASQLGAKSMIVLDAGYPCALTEPPRGIVAGVLYTLSLALRNQVQVMLPVLAETHAIIYLPAPCPVSTSPHDFSQSQSLIAAGYELAAEALSDYVANGPGVQGHPHSHD